MSCWSDGAGFAPLGKWSLEATILVWYPGEVSGTVAMSNNANQRGYSGWLGRRHLF
ncbi:hypothetical protein [Mycobacterium sp. Z3061]|uniref:hypothetical protein n=1 Tax=Mycobacterium sp. Z3061 TaxID=3073562 RepID=UPI002873D7C0|nr:hypothetical protein [Mycobacterium sp. Z3061]